MDPIIIEIYENIDSYELAIEENLEPVTIEIIEAGIGPAGLSAYQVAVLNGFVGTEAEWLESLKGEPGDGGTVTWNDVQDKPATFTPSEHLHEIYDINGLQGELNDKQPIGNYAATIHGHDATDITGTKTSSFISDFAASVRNTILTGISFVTGTDVTGSDSILSAFGKLQAKWTDLFDSGTGKIKTSHLPDSILGQVSYQGGWNAATNTPAIPAAATGNKGQYYVTSVAGSLYGLDFNVGDWIISNGSAWEKVDNTDAVATVFGRTGTITAQSGDYTADQITETASRVFISPTQKGYLPSSGEKDALVGTTGTPGSGNKYVTNSDTRLSDARTPTTHNHDDRYYTEVEVIDLLAAKQNSLVDYESSTLTNSTLGSANTWYNIIQIPLIPAGRYLVTFQITIGNPSGIAIYHFRVNDGTNVLFGGRGFVPNTADRPMTYTISKFINLSSTSVISAQARCSVANSYVTDAYMVDVITPNCTNLVLLKIA